MDNQLPPVPAPFFTISFSPIIILAHTRHAQSEQHSESSEDTALLGFFAALFGANFQPNVASGLQGQPPASEAAMTAQRVLDPDQVPTGATCSVCIEDLLQTSTNDEQSLVNTVRCMPCNHAYHETCLFTWLKQSATCPTCRFEIESDNMEWNAASSRRAAERAERTREMRDEHERQRRASRRENNQAACGLVAVSCCQFVDDDLSGRPDSAFADAERNIVMLPCNHSFHRNCLITNLRVQGEEVPTEIRELVASNVEVRCPRCRKISHIPLEELHHVMPNATADDRPPVAAEHEATAETNSVPRMVTTEVLLPETLLPEELETD